MKKGFTLVEMLVVVVVIVTLMTMTFRLSSIGGDQSRRNNTVARMQRIENCLSGYYAAFGSYPPVKMHGSRNINAKANRNGIQSDKEERMLSWSWQYVDENDEEREDWLQVKAACKSQPVDCRFPFPQSDVYKKLIQTVSDILKKKANTLKDSDSRKVVLSKGFDDGVSANVNRHATDESDWRQVQLFKYGLMSYLLPRYLVMMYSRVEFFYGGSNGYDQWKNNNKLPCNPMNGSRKKDIDGEPWDWELVRDYGSDEMRVQNPRKYAQVANIPSQVACARWMPNLEGIVCCNHDFNLYGIDIRGDSNASELRPDNLDIQVYSPGGYDGHGDQYVLDSVTVLDGWWHEFYYYSPPPYQSYTLWSGGANNRTFPPWISRESLSSTAKKCVSVWTEDDIVRMSH